MPIISTQGAINTGRDCTVVLIGPYGLVQLDNVTGFDCRQQVAKIHSDRLDGVQQMADLPKGWVGTLDVDRGTNALDLLVALIEDGWMSGGAYQNSTLFQYVAESDGSTTVFVFDNVALSLSDAGAWRPDQITKQRLEFSANRRRVV